MDGKKSRLFILLVLVLIIAGGGYYYYHTKSDDPLTLYGNVDVRTVNLSFRVGGKLQSLRVDEGDKVSVGQPLGQLDDTPFINARDKAQGLRDSAQAELEMMKTGYRTEEIAQVRSEVSQKQAAWQYAERFYQRQQGLINKSAISANDLENAKNQRNQALAAYNAAKDKLSQYESGYRKEQIAQAQGQLLQAQAALAQAELDIQDTLLSAPSDGVILTRAIEPGTILGAGNTVFTLSLIHPVWVRAYISETRLGDAVPGNKVLLYTDSRPDKPYHGQIGFVSPTAEFTPKSVETPELRTDLVYRLRIVVTDADEHLRQGMPMTINFDDNTTQNN